MPWNGRPRLPHTPPPTDQNRPSHRRALRWMPAGLAILVLGAALVPAAALAATPSVARLTDAWNPTRIQESSSRIDFSGGWTRAAHPDYLGGKAKATTHSGAAAKLTFRGSAVAWVGPVGPTRGQAKVFVDGALAATINTHADSFHAKRVLFRKTWGSVGQHRIAVVASGTARHPMVAVDAFLVRGSTAGSGSGGSGSGGSGSGGTGKTVHVGSIPALLDALADNRVTEIVVANGTYRVSPAGQTASNSLWIGKRFASRTNAVTVRAATRGDVTFDGGGAGYFGGLAFVAGAHHQTWDGFNFANGQATDTGVIMIGGYSGLAAPHHITLNHIRVLSSATGRTTSASSSNTDAAIYIAQAVGGPHDLKLLNINVDGRGYLGSAIQFYHSDSGNPNAHDVVIRDLTVNRTQVAIMIWDSTLRNITVDTARISDAMRFAVSYESPGSGILLKNITSTGSGEAGFSSSYGSHPPGVTFSGNSFH